MTFSIKKKKTTLSWAGDKQSGYKEKWMLGADFRYKLPHLYNSYVADIMVPKAVSVWFSVRCLLAV